MKKARIFGILLSVVMTTSVLFGCGKTTSTSAPAVNDGKKIVLKLGHTGNPDHPYQEASLKFAEIVSEKTNGQIEVKVFPSDQLGKQNELVEGAQLGTVDMVLTSDTLLSTFVPEIGILNLPFLFEDSEHVQNVLNGTVGDKIETKLEAKNLIAIGWWENGFRDITNSKRPIVVPADLKGLKIRTPSGAVFLDTFNMLGASATPMSFGELYSALQLGAVDGQENPTTHIVTQKFYEVQKYLSITHHIHVAEPLLMSKAVYNKLTPDQQKILTDAGDEVSKWIFEKMGNLAKDEIKQIEAEGMLINNADIEAFKKATLPIYEKYEPEFGKDLIKEIQDTAK
ncbi:TRAP transporter substrate-binding protein [Clostridium sp.]|uniref:TRAP transporter substrate-binding protein n=1 Tax=Clostridium sp. TaxID=1506 RepID=UPI001A5F6164|nr:TRAP transporter substrate-binding protein [Clostridium sp.]MBK5241487.1 TRAP transporter substrate-binding protein [Clostridium sp.]